MRNLQNSINSDALNKIGYIYENGIGIKQDYLKAKEYYEASSKLNNSDAFYFLGNLYYFGYGVEQNYLKAKEFYEKSSKLKNSDAFIKLGKLYEYGLGVKRDYLKASDFYIKSLKLDNMKSLTFLGDIYFGGHGVQQDYLVAKKMYEMASEFNDSNALYYLGNMFYYGLGVKQNFLKAKEFYEQSSKFNNSSALISLGIIYENGYSVPKDYLKAKEYYEKSSKLNDSTAFIFLANLYYYGYGVKQDYLIAKEYLEKSLKFNNLNSLSYIGTLYENGYGVEQNYLKALECYEQSSKNNNPYSLYKIAQLYENGHGVVKNHLKAIKYYELSASLNHSKSCFKLGVIYSTGEYITINIAKAIKYYLKSISIKRGRVFFYDIISNIYYTSFDSNNYRYISNNDLGLIYLLFYNDIEKSYQYIKESAYAEYPFGQNNSIYLENLVNAEYFFVRSSEHKFSLAEYNLGHLYEENNKINESIQHYIQASENEDEPLEYRDIKHNDKSLEISKTFIICLTNLKLAEYYFSLFNYTESKKYFIKAFKKLISNNENADVPYNFRFEIQLGKKEYSNNILSYLKIFILNHPLFNLKNQSNEKIISILNLYLLNNSINSQIKQNNKMKINNIKDDHKIVKHLNCIPFYKKEIISITNKEYGDISKFKYEKNNYQNENHKIVFTKIGELFDFIIQETNSKTKIREIFINEIKNIIVVMNKILYTPPYSILFGRISINKQKSHQENDYILTEDLSQDFYDAFGVE